MPEPTTPAVVHTSTAHAVRHHLWIVVIFLVLGLVGGWYYASKSPASYTSTASVLVNPTAGNPFVPTPSSVRQDELTSLETEAQVMRSAEVLGRVVTEHPEWKMKELQRGLTVTVPPNTQVLDVTFTSGDKAKAQAGAQAIADAYLTNRAIRFDDVNADRIARVQARTTDVEAKLKDAASKTDEGSKSEQLYWQEMTEAYRNELVSLRAQRTALDNAEAPEGEVIAPAEAAVSAAGLTAKVMPVGGALAGLALGVMIAVLLERHRGRIRSEHDVEVRGLRVFAAVPARRRLTRLARLVRRRQPQVDLVDVAVRRLRATILDLSPRPDVITIAPTGVGHGDAGATEAVAHSFAKAGHSVVLVRADLNPTTGSSAIEEREGLAQVLMYERLNVLELLQPTLEPLLSVLPDGGYSAQTRELLVADRFRSALSPLTDAGHLVVVQAAGVETPEGEAAVGASDLSVVVVRQGRTRPQAVDRVVKLLRRTGRPLVALAVGPHSIRHAPTRIVEDADSSSSRSRRPVKREQRTRAPR